MKEVILCESCKGQGQVKKSILVDYHKRDYDYWWATCKDCYGTGRKYKITTVRYEPMADYEVDDDRKDRW